MTFGADALGDWVRRGGKPAYDALWRACGWGWFTVDAICVGEVVPDADLAGALMQVTGGAVTIDMFDRPAGRAAA